MYNIPDALKGKIKMPRNDSKLKHIFRDEEGHLPDTPENRKMILDLANDVQYYVGKDRYGNDWNIRNNEDGTQDCIIILRTHSGERKMSKYELFCLIFMALDADWDESHNEELGRYLSDANPFLFAENVSAVQDVFIKFSSFIGDREITKVNSFSIAKEYIDYLNIPAVSESFSTLEPEQWSDALEEYLGTAHKG